MLDPTSFQSDLRRYAALIERLINPQPLLIEETQSSLQVERAIIYPSLLTGPWSPEKAKIVEPLIVLARDPNLARIPILDLSGHHRPVYRPLLIYSWLMAYRLAYETMPRQTFGQWEEGLRPWCDSLENRLNEIDWPATGFSAGAGDIAAEAAWIALTLHVAGKSFIRDAWTDLASDTFGKLARHQQPNGSFLRSIPADNPEAQSYHELILLHAAATYAVQSADRPLSVAVAKSAEYHVNHTQPDHATTQPWSLFPFIWHAPARPLADQLLHAAATNQPAGLTGLPAVLLADALYCLRLFL